MRPDAMRTLAPLALATTLLAGCASAPAPRAATAAPVAAAVVPAPIDVPAIAHPGGEDAAWWYRAGAARAAANGAMAGRARNVVLFLGDGMSLPTVAAARIHEAQQRRGAPGEENALAFERFPHTALSKTYNTDYQTPDSAGTMTAIATGVKTRLGVIGVDQGAVRGECAGSAARARLSLLELAESAGLATGIVTTTRLTHATPASAFAHGPDRTWEGDADLPPEARAGGCRDLAAQFVESRFGDGIDVALAGGRALFLPASMRDPADRTATGERGDGRNLIDEWQRRRPGGRFVATAAQLAAAREATAVLGLFEASHLPYESDRTPAQPSLADLVRAAIPLLQRDADGFVLVVEGGRIDHAHHDGNARRALEDTVAFSDAVRAAAELTADTDTLVLVTADHAHTMHFAGYPVRGNPILDKVRGISGEDRGGGEYALDRDRHPYTTLGYANGPGAERRDLSRVDTTALEFRQPALVPLASESHGGDDVGVWARGPGADAVRGTLEQNVLFHLMVQAAPALRARLCAAGTCNADGVPVELPRPDDFLPRQAPARL